MNIVIRQNVKIPTINECGIPIPLDEMEPGDYVFIPEQPQIKNLYRTVSVRISRYYQKGNQHKKFITRHMEENEVRGRGIWRVK